MAPKLFLTGATGYIGGSVLHTLVTSHPDYDFTVLLRSIPSDWTERFPSVRVIKGDYDSTDIITSAASQADVVVHSGDSDHEPSINALIAGLLKRDTATQGPGFLIHLGGTGIVADFRTGTPGVLNSKVWSDVKNIDEIWSLPDKSLHRNVDKIIQQAATEHGDRLKTAIMCPPDIYGRGHGPGRKESFYIPLLWEETEKLQATFYTADGSNTRSFVHIDDLMKVYLKLVEAAVAGGGNAEWGLKGYYFTSSQEWSQLDLARQAGKILKKKGLIPTEEPRKISKDELDQMLARRGGGPILPLYMFASNSRTWPDRAISIFDYRPDAPTLIDSMESDLAHAITDGPKKF